MQSQLTLPTSLRKFRTRCAYDNDGSVVDGIGSNAATCDLDFAVFGACPHVETSVSLGEGGSLTGMICHVCRVCRSHQGQCAQNVTAPAKRNAPALAGLMVTQDAVAAITQAIRSVRRVVGGAQVYQYLWPSGKMILVK